MIHIDCAEAVVPEWADGEEMPCRAPSVAHRYDPSAVRAGQVDATYPVCVDHVREPMQRLNKENDR